jgi:hypothetical protein
MTSPDKRSEIDVCTELINQATKCLEDLDKRCTMRLIKELIKNQCHDGRIAGGEVANEVKEIVHRLWVICNYAEEYEILALRKLGVSKVWLAHALHKKPREIQWYFKRYGLG